MKSLVSSEPWRADANSGSGVKHATSLILKSAPAMEAAAETAGFRFQMIQLASTFPMGIKR